MVLFIQTGFLVAFSAVCFAIVLIIRYFYTGQNVTGWTSLFVSLYFIFGTLLFGIGILGVYIGHIFNQVKGRPFYVIEDLTNNVKKNND